MLTASGQPADVDVVALDLLVVDQQEHLLRLLVVARGCLGLRKVEVEHVVIEEVALFSQCE